MFGQDTCAHVVHLYVHLLALTSFNYVFIKIVLYFMLAAVPRSRQLAIGGRILAVCLQCHEQGPYH